MNLMGVLSSWRGMRLRTASLLGRHRLGMSTWSTVRSTREKRALWERNCLENTLEKHQLEDQQDALVVDNLQEALDKVPARNQVWETDRKESQASFQAENRPYEADVGPFARHAETLEDNQVVLPSQGT